jgi:site-specific recombinase XerD
MTTKNTRPPRWDEMDKSHLPLRTAVEHYLTACRVEGKSPRTLSGYQEKLGRYLRTEPGTLGDFTLAGARDYVATLQAALKWADHPFMATSTDRLSPQTVADHVRILKGFGTWLWEEGYTPENVLQRLQLPKVPSRIVEVLAEGEVTALLAAVDPDTTAGARDLAILTLFLDTGLRLSELVGLQIGDAHFEEQWLKVMGKGSKERIVPFGSRAAKVLSRYVTFFRPDPRDTEALFLSSDGGPVTLNTIKMLCTRLRQRSRIERLHVHLLRHTFATSYLLAGGDVFTLQAILGHTTLEMTRRYVNLASAHVAVQHRRFSPMDRLHSPELKAAAATAPRWGRTAKDPIERLSAMRAHEYGSGRASPRRR